MSAMKPFLKWAGNKYRIIERIKAVLPPGKRLIEPFVGSGAVFLNTEYPSYLLADANADLINLYQQLQAEEQRFIDHCRSFFVPENNQAERFYEFRQQFNNTVDPVEKAALFVYLNRHCYNGLCRYNAKGRFNVPFGRYARPYFPQIEMNLFWQRARTATFLVSHFVDILEQAEPGDVVYCDPPYVPLSKTSSFTSYSKHRFGMKEQEMLVRLAKSLAQRGIVVAISNHDTGFSRKAYADADQIESFQVQRFISRNGNGRAKVAETLVVYGHSR